MRVFLVDAFTSRPFTGNPAGVVLDAGDLDAGRMQAMARELCPGDTAFVLPPDAGDHDLRVRFFSPRRELPFVGHATIAVHAVLASLGEPSRPRQKQQSGLVDVDCVAGFSPPRVTVHLPPPELGALVSSHQVSELLAALGISPQMLDPQCPIQIAGKTSTRVMVGVIDGGVLASLRPDFERLAALCNALAAPGVFIFTRHSSVADASTEARMLCPALGFNEDPVSGNAHGMLAIYLHHYGLLGAGNVDGSAQIIQFCGAQGHHMGRPGMVSVALQTAAGVPTGVAIGGEAVIVMTGNMHG